jgi:uncharacterized membrane protein YbhN (UPF0104 family)/tRNA A-37 threonylcarbamoyl transferase component Bud32
MADHPDDTIDSPVVYDVPERPETIRSPSDVLRFAVSLTVTLAGVAVIAVTDQSATIWDAGLVDYLAGIGDRPIDRIGIVLVQVAALSLPLIVVLVLWWAGIGWRLLLIIGGMAGGATVVWLLDQALGRTVPTIYLDTLDADLWVAPAGFPNGPYVAGLVAAIVVAGPYLSRRWRRATWILVWAIVLFRVWSLTALVFDALVAISVGWMVGAAILYIFGAPNRTPAAPMVVAALARAGIVPARIESAFVDARASSPYFVVDRTGRRYFIKVLSGDERSADLMFRIYRWARMRNSGDERAFSSLRRSVEHEALVAYHALAAGVSTPPVRAVADVDGTSMVLVYDAWPLRTLDHIEPDELAEQHLLNIWAQVSILRATRCAHRDLRLANLAVDEDGRAVVIDFGFSELAASDELLHADVAELVLSSSTTVGARRAVDAAVGSLGEQAVVDAAPWMQPLAVSGATRTALKNNKGLVAEVREEIARFGGDADVELAPIERIRPKTLATLIALGVAFYLLIPQLADVDFETVSRADLAWVVAAILLTGGKYLGNALAVHGSVPKRLQPAGPFVAELAATFANRVTPAKVGGLAVNGRYLEKAGVRRGIALAAIGLVALVSAVVHLASLIVFAIWTGRRDLAGIEMPSGEAVLVGLAAVLAIVGLVVKLPRARTAWNERVYPAIRESRDGLATVASSPARLLLMFGGTLLAVVAYVGALFASIEAFGGGLAFATVGVVYLAGSAIGGLAPIPGGIGAIEAALIAGLTAFGLDPPVAVPGVLLFRIVSFWLPILPGWLAMVHMERTGQL